MKRLAAAAMALMMGMASMSVSAASAKAVFDFGDNAFFRVPMQQGESVYLALDTQYNKETAQQVLDETGREADRFYSFDMGDTQFYRTGELFLEGEETQSVYALLEDGTLEELDAEYTQGYVIGKDGKRMNGFVLRTKTLGNYIIVE